MPALRENLVSTEENVIHLLGDNKEEVDCLFIKIKGRPLKTPSLLGIAQIPPPSPAQNVSSFFAYVFGLKIKSAKINLDKPPPLPPNSDNA